MSFEMMAFDGVRGRRKGSKRVCGCTMEQTKRGVPLIVCPGGLRRFASRRDGVALLGRERSGGSFCIFVRRGRKHSRKAKRR